MKNMFLSLSILIFLVACETGYKVEKNTIVEEEENISSAIIKKTPKAKYIEQLKEPTKAVDINFTGGKVSDRLDIGTIRVSHEKNSIRLVFDSYKWNLTSEYLGEKVDNTGSYHFNYSPKKSLITATVDGYRGFSAKLPTFDKNSIIEEMSMNEYLDDSGYKFHIKLRYDAEVKVFDLKNPARIVLDITLK
jgi:hypothetical protein